MDISNLYIPNVTTWIKYYQDSINKHTFNGEKRNQRGGSLVSGAKTIITPIENNKKNESSQMDVNDVPVKIISPAQAVVEQASTKSNIWRMSRMVLKGNTNPKLSEEEISANV
ncbi:Hypothetical predicted protein [Mytilus galloprovincialis]|uniref:Uncharacterized protein n=1 Tax=Mytilus galloprovincialis TaxID=29158 RepID=A0A8B6F5U5_MYTGA|nr:Hypothetical predicted protein [Mytilus galloprovincialis]